MKRIAVVGVIVAASSMVSGLAVAGVGASSSDDQVRVPSGPVGGVEINDEQVLRLVRKAAAAVDEIGGGEAAPAPTPGGRPEDLLNAAIQTVSKTGSDVALGLGGIVVPPLPSPTPGIEPDPGGRNTRTINKAIQTVSKTGSDVALGLGGIVVPPLPAPTPGIKPPIAIP